MFIGFIFFILLITLVFTWNYREDGLVVGIMKFLINKKVFIPVLIFDFFMTETGQEFYHTIYLKVMVFYYTHFF